jgi:hypothetical protein
VCERTQLVSAKEIAQEYGVPVGTVYDRARRDRWPRFKIGHAIRFDPDEIKSLLRVDAEEPADAPDARAVIRRLRAVREVPGYQGGDVVARGP